MTEAGVYFHPHTKIYFPSAFSFLNPTHYPLLAAHYFPPMSKSDVLNRVKSEKVIALIRADSSASLLDCARALAAGGLSCIELTMTTPNAIECCAQVAKELPNVLLGLGTVLDAETAK